MKKVTLIAAILGFVFSSADAQTLSPQASSSTQTTASQIPLHRIKGYDMYEVWLDTILSDQAIKASQFKITDPITLTKISKPENIKIINGTVTFQNVQTVLTINGNEIGTVVGIENRSDSMFVESLEDGKIVNMFSGVSDTTRFLWVSFDDHHNGTFVVPFATQPDKVKKGNNQFSTSQALINFKPKNQYAYAGTTYQIQGEAMLMYRNKTAGHDSSKTARGSKARKGVVVNNK